MNMEKNYYDILGVDKNATQDEIKKAYRNLSKIYHPDKNKDNKDAEKKFKEINEAHSVLGDEQKRKEYDMKQSFGSAGFNPFESHWNPFGSNFTGGFGFRTSYQMASDITMSLTISLEDAYYGCKKPIRVGMRNMNVDIPKGVTTGKKLKLSGLGVKGHDIYGKEAMGDLIITINVQNTEKMWLNNDGSLEVMYSLNWLDAILGAEQEIDIFDKIVKFRCPKFTQNGGYSLISNKGFPKFKEEGKYGNIKVNYIIKMPKNLTDEQLKLLNKIKGDNQ